MTIYNLGNVKGEKGDRGECAPGPTGPPGVGIKSIEQITTLRFKICLTDGSEYYINYGGSTPTPESMTLTGDVTTLMAGETAHLMAAVYDENHNLIPGQIVTMGVYKTSDDSLVESLTVTDVGNGTYTANYTGNCIGDLYVKADCMLLSEIYGISCEDYQAMIDNSDEFKWSIPSAVSSSSIFGYSSDGWKFGNAPGFRTITYNGIACRPFSLECIVTDSNGLQPIIGAMFGSSYIFADRYSNDQLRINVNGSTTIYNVSYSSVYTFRYELTDSTFSVYIDDVLIATVNHSLTGDCVPALQTGDNRYTVIKDFKLKPL